MGVSIHNKAGGSRDIDALKSEIDEAVYDLLDLDEQEREVIEEHLKVF